MYVFMINVISRRWAKIGRHSSIGRWSPTRMAVWLARFNEVIDMFEVPQEKGCRHLGKAGILLEPPPAELAVKVCEEEDGRRSDQQQQHIFWTQFRLDIKCARLAPPAEMLLRAFYIEMIIV